MRTSNMVLTDKSCQLTRALRRISRPAICTRCLKARRNVTMDVRSDSIQDPTNELEQSSGLGSSGPLGALSDSFDPLRASRSRKKQLPPSRYALSRMFCSGRAPATMRVNMSILDINFGHPNTTADLSTRTNLLLHQIRRPGFSYQGPFHPHASSRPTII